MRTSTASIAASSRSTPAIQRTSTCSDRSRASRTCAAADTTNWATRRRRRMLRRPFPDATLGALRRIGDPKLDNLRIDDVEGYFSDVATRGLDVALGKSGAEKQVIADAKKDFNDAIAVLNSYGIEATVAISRARELFTKYGDEISAALLLAGLPNSYATAWGARVLVRHGDLVFAVPRRVRQTAMF